MNHPQFKNTIKLRWREYVLNKGVKLVYTI